MDSFFKSQDAETAPAKIAEHIRKLWDPRMRQQIFGHLDAGGTGLNPNSRKAIELLRAGFLKCFKTSRFTRAAALLR